MAEFVDPKTFLKCSKKEFISSCAVGLREGLIDDDWVIYPQKIATGSTAMIFTAFLDGDRSKPYFLKYLLHRTRKELENEVCMQDLAYEIGLAPKILEWWICDEDENAIIVMERTGSMNLEKYLNSMASLEGNSIDNFIRTMQLYKIMFQVFCMGYKLNEAGILHGDLNLGNITLTFDEEEEKMLYIEKVYFIDYGFATRITNITKNVLDLCKREKSILEIADAVTKTFKLLNIDRTLTLDLLKNFLKSTQVAESRNPYLRIILEGVGTTFYDDFMLIKLIEPQGTWSSNSYESFQEELREVVSDGIGYLIEDNAYEIDVEALVEQLLG